MTIANQIARFPSQHRPAVRKYARMSMRVADVAFSYPLLLVAIATGYGPAEARSQALDTIERGEPLTEAARAVGLPMCLRKVAPEACTVIPPPARWSANASRSLANAVPELVEDTSGWLRATFYALRACDEDFAIWVGRQKVLGFADRFDPCMLRPLAIYAWHSRQADHPLHWLAFSRWTPSMSFATALTEAQYFFNRLKLMAYFEESPIADMWLEGGHADGFDFVPLKGFWDVMEERIDMRNCLDCYADKLASNACRVFGVRRQGRKMATIEIGISHEDGERPRLSQLKSPGNADPTLATWHAAWTWFGRQRETRIWTGEPVVPLERRIRSIAKLLKPYSDAVEEPMGLPECAPPLIDGKLTELARRGCVSGFPFRLLA